MNKIFEKLDINDRMLFNRAKTQEPEHYKVTKLVYKRLSDLLRTGTINFREFQLLYQYVCIRPYVKEM